MAKENTFYFSHDYNVRSDIKIRNLILKHGALGYGVFWMLIEDLYNNTNVLPLNYDLIAFDLRVEKNVLKSVINDFNLFVVDKESFGSLSVQRRLDERDEKSRKAKESIAKRWEKLKTDTNVLRTKNDSNTIKESKVKESKVKESKVSSIFTPPILEDVINYFFENGYSKESAAKAFRYYNDADWKDSKGTKVKNWKQKMQGVWFKSENEIKKQQTQSVTRITM